ncbi:MAG: hypothetical protein ACPG05_05135, partial [Bdellovibrionales bacterium]
FDPKKYALLFIGIFAVTLVVLVAVSEVFLRTLVIPTSNFHKHLDYYHNVQDVEIAAFGDSRMSQGFYSQAPSIANLSYAGESMEQISTKITHFIENKKTDMIILQVGHHMLADYRFDSDRRDYNKFFAKETNWREGLILSDPVMRGQLLKYWRMFFASKGHVPNTSTFTENGSVVIDFVMNYPPNETQKKYRIVRTAEHTLKANYKDRKTWGVLEETIERIKGEGIKLCLVSFPVTPFYKETVLSQKYTQEAIDKFHEIAREKNVPYFFYWDLYDGQYEYFRNLDHLNVKGAEKFTKKLVKDCRNKH